MLLGTLHIVAHGVERTIICSDSRGHSPDDGPFDEDFQKLFKAGRRTVCATSGLLTLPPDLYVSTIIDNLCNDELLRDRPEQLLSAIRNEMQPRLSAAFADYPVPDIRSIFSAFSIRRKPGERPGGKLHFWELEFLIKTAANGSRSIAEPTVVGRFKDEYTKGPFVFFTGQSVPETFTRTINADEPNAETLLKSIDETFEAARALSSVAHDEIGGPVDVAELTSNGFGWLRRKPIHL